MLHPLRRLFSSSGLAFFFGALGLAAQFTPWAILRIGEMWGGGRVETLTGIYLMTAFGERRPILIFFLLSCIVCIATPFFTKDPSRRGWRGPLYVGYAALTIVTINDMERWITMPRAWIPEEVGWYSNGIGMTLAWTIVMGLALAAVVAFAERRPTQLHADTLAIGAASGTVVLYCFFNVAWAVPLIFNDPAFKLTGFDLAFEFSSYLGWPTIPYVDAAFPSINIYFWPMLLYSIVALSIILIISPALNGKNRRLELPRMVQIVSGSIIVLFCLLIIASSTIAPQSGLLTTMAVGVFLVIYQATAVISRRRNKSKDDSASLSTDATIISPNVSAGSAC